jgi:hypothetical protein
VHELVDGVEHVSQRGCAGRVVEIDVGLQAAVEHWHNLIDADDAITDAQ